MGEGVVFSGKLAAASQLSEMPLPQGGVRLELIPGQSTVLVAEKVKPRRFFTYDTGSKTTLFVDLGPSFDPQREVFVLEQFPAASLQIASMRILYRSRRASGRLELRKGLKRQWFGKAFATFDVSINLLFDEPQLDQAGLGAVPVDWRLSIPADFE
ncbi:hypothetical protein ACWIGM_10400 [Bosea sp. NPDC055332]